MDFSRMNANEQRQLEAYMERRQMQDFLNLYNNLNVKCFEDCITDFTTRSVTPREVCSIVGLKFIPYGNVMVVVWRWTCFLLYPFCFDGMWCLSWHVLMYYSRSFAQSACQTLQGQCVTHCVDKFLKMSQRLSQRFAEQQNVLQQWAASKTVRKHPAATIQCLPARRNSAYIETHTESRMSKEIT